MVALTPRFALLAVLASLAAFSLAPADAAAVTARGKSSHADSDSYSSASAHGASVTSSSNLESNLVIPLPSHLASQATSSVQDFDSQSSKKKSKSDKKNQSKHKESEKRSYSWSAAISQRSQAQDDLPPLLSRIVHHKPKPIVDIEGENDHVRFGRSPEPHHHHHHHHQSDHVDEKVIVKGDNDNVNIGRSSEPRHHNHHHNDDGDKVVVKGNNDNVHVGRSPEPHHHHPHNHHHGSNADTVIVKGNNDNVNVGRSPEPHSHHHNHGGEKVVIKGNNDNVHLDSKRGVVINDLQGNASYVVAHTRRGHARPHQKVVLIKGSNINTRIPRYTRRDAGVMEGVPGTIDIMSNLVNQAVGTRIASLVLAHPEENIASTTDANAIWIMNASEKNFTQVYLVPVSMNGTASTSNTTTPEGDIPVSLKLAVFDPNSASVVPYCATFDPNPPAPAPLTAEPCFAGQSEPPHKSQVFSYTSANNALRPMWYKGEDDGKGSGSEEGASVPQDPHTPEAAGAASITSTENNENQLSDGDFGNSTAPASVADLGNSTTSDTPTQGGLQARAQNVTMIFTPATAELPADLGGSNDDAGVVNPITPLASNITGKSATTSGNAFNSTNDSTLSGAGSSPTSTVSSDSTQATKSVAEELQVMVGVARDEESSGTVVRSVDPLMTPVSTAPYKWRFRRDSS